MAETFLSMEQALITFESTQSPTMEHQLVCAWQCMDATQVKFQKMTMLIYIDHCERSLVDWLNLICKLNPLLVIYFHVFYLFVEDFPSLGVVLQRSDDEPNERSSWFDTRYAGECKVSGLLELDLFVSLLCFDLCFFFLVCFFASLPHQLAHFTG